MRQRRVDGRDVSWGSPVALESAYDSRIMDVDGKSVGEVARWTNPDGVWRYAPHLYDSDQDDLGTYPDAWDAMVALEVAVGVRPLAHTEAWGLPLAKEDAEWLDEEYLVKRRITK